MDDVEAVIRRDGLGKVVQIFPINPEQFEEGVVVEAEARDLLASLANKPIVSKGELDTGVARLKLCRAGRIMYFVRERDHCYLGDFEEVVEGKSPKIIGPLTKEAEKQSGSVQLSKLFLRDKFPVAFAKAYMRRVSLNFYGTDILGRGDDIEGFYASGYVSEAHQELVLQNLRESAGRLEKALTKGEVTNETTHYTGNLEACGYKIFGDVTVGKMPTGEKGIVRVGVQVVGFDRQGEEAVIQELMNLGEFERKLRNVPLKVNPDNPMQRILSESYKYRVREIILNSYLDRREAEGVALFRGMPSEKPIMIGDASEVIF